MRQGGVLVRKFATTGGSDDSKRKHVQIWPGIVGDDVGMSVGVCWYSCIVDSGGGGSGDYGGGGGGGGGDVALVLV